MDTDPVFLGRGWGFPPTFTANGRDVVTVPGDEDVHQSLQIIAATVPGERVMRPDFGCDLAHLQFEEIDHGFINRVRQLVTNAVRRHEPRVNVNDVDVSVDPNDPGTVAISIDYTVRSSNSRFNMVFPFYVDEARTPGV